MTNRRQRFVEEFARCVPQEIVGAFPRNHSVFGTSNDLVEQRQGVAHRATACTNHQRKNAVFNLDFFLDAQLRNVLEHCCRGDQSKRIVVGSRSDGADDLFRLGRRKDELDVLRWLFNDFEEGVESLLSDHVRFVKNVNLVTVARRCKAGSFTQIAGIIDPVVACRVNLDDIDRA